MPYPSSQEGAATDKSTGTTEDSGQGGAKSSSAKGQRSRFSDFRRKHKVASGRSGSCGDVSVVGSAGQPVSYRPERALKIYTHEDVERHTEEERKATDAQKSTTERTD